MGVGCVGGVRGLCGCVGDVSGVSGVCGVCVCVHVQSQYKRYHTDTQRRNDVSYYKHT